MDTLTRVTQALQILYQNSDPESKKEANLWLEQFQKTSEAWIVSDSILQKSDLALDAKLFAAQTLRYKFFPVSEEFFNSASKEFVVCPTSATDPAVPDLSRSCCTACRVGGSTVLPEEVLFNDRILVERSVYAKIFNNLLTSQAKNIVQLLVWCLQNPQVDSEIHIKVLDCLSSWLKSGELSLEMLLSTQLLDFAFSALEYEDDSVFETAVDTVCGYIFECKDPSSDTTNPEKNTFFLQSLQALLIKLTVLSEKMKFDKSVTEDHDIDKMRGYCRIFTEACDAWVKQMVESPLDFRNLLDSMLFVMQFPCLEVLPMTFGFWNDLSLTINRLSRNMPPEQKKIVFEVYNAVFNSLIEIIIVHLRYPLEYDGFSIQEEAPVSTIINTSSFVWTAKDRDDFSDFRHDIGDVLKDSVSVVGQELALQKPYNILVQNLAVASQTNNVPWQLIEAPLFAIRAMGSEISHREDGTMAQIMDLISKLPYHPKIRYASTLVLGRYTEWTFYHPQYIQFQLEYIISGFEIPEVISASSQALKYLCKDCSTYLATYWRQLESFYSTLTLSGKLSEDDILDLTEAVAHVINAIPDGELPPAFEAFCLPLIKNLELQAASEKRDPMHTLEISQNLKRITTFLKFVESNKSSSSNDIILKMIDILWPLLISVIDKHAANGEISESAGRLLRIILVDYLGKNPTAYIEGIELIVRAYQFTGFGVYVWVAKKFIEEYGSDVYLPADSPEAVRSNSCGLLLDKLTEITLGFLSNGTINVETSPEPVEEMYLLITSCLRAQPMRTIKSLVFLQALQFSLIAIRSVVYYVQEAVLEMWYAFMSPSVRHLKNYRDELESRKEKFYIPMKSLERSGELVKRLESRVPLPDYQSSKKNHVLSYDIQRVSLIIATCGYELAKDLFSGLASFTFSDLVPLSIDIFVSLVQFISEGAFISKAILSSDELREKQAQDFPALVKNHLSGSGSESSDSNIDSAILEIDSVDMTALYWIKSFLNDLPPTTIMLDQEKSSFCDDFSLHLSTRHWARLRNLFFDFSYVFRLKNNIKQEKNKQ
ncbi:hypothetical protein BB560_000002 [Smittium megazygosporum]|uniref:Uncharacterized protein n=1 Tax=Smittium megazygosporum TaxID=133381 RepID=A0A2T9ZLP4_9FUNG|nr:hypothetical protein BB560_000002 [Smittium megazygosporum]